MYLAAKGRQYNLVDKPTWFPFRFEANDNQVLTKGLQLQ